MGLQGKKKLSKPYYIHYVILLRFTMDVIIILPKKTSLFQFKLAWKTSSPTYTTIILKKHSEFTRFFRSAIIRLRTTGQLDVLMKRKLGLGRSCNHPTNENPIGYEKSIVLFTLLISGIILSLIFVLCEYIAQHYVAVKQESTLVENQETTIMDEKIEYILNGLSDTEKENIYKKLLQNKKKLNMKS